MIWAAMAAAGAMTVADLSWLVGDWVEEKPGVATHETWLAPRDGLMAGVGQIVRPGQAAKVEFVTIGRGEAGLTFTAIVDGQSPTPFVLKSGAPGEAVFENLGHDFPQRVIYRPCGADLCARIEGMVAGKLEGQDWRYRRTSAEGR